MQTANVRAKRIHLSPSVSSRPSRPDKLVIPTADFIELLPIAEIAYARADGSYCTFFMENGSQCLSSKTLGSYEDLLEQCGFVRPHQSYIVNTRNIRRIRKVPYCALCMHDNTEIPVARARRKELIDGLSGEHSARSMAAPQAYRQEYL